MQVEVSSNVGGLPEDESLSTLEAAIASLPANSKAPLLMTREKIPDRASKEAPPIRILRFTRFKAAEAANRLIEYWSTRKHVFGDKAFERLIIAGDGALARTETLDFGCGYMIPLPYDEQGRSVVFSDCRRIGKVFTDRARQILSRMSFCFWSIISENPKSQTDGVTLFIRCSSPDEVTASLEQLVLGHCERSIPVRIRAIHILADGPSFDKLDQQAITKSLTDRMELISDDLKRAVCVHVAPAADLASKLVEAGVVSNVDKLPVSVGGTWEYERFEVWMELRIRSEWDLPPLRGTEKETSLPHLPKFTAKKSSELTKMNGQAEHVF